MDSATADPTAHPTAMRTEPRPPCAALSARQIRLVQISWQHVLPIDAQAAALFYGRLFELDPSLRPMFRNDAAEQGRKLMAALNIVVQGLDRLPELLPVVQQLGRRHVAYGVQPAHYETVGQALVWTLAQGLGDTATDEVLQAWAQAYGCVADAMQQAAWPPGASGAEWQAQAA